MGSSVFNGITDEELIRELKWRGRLRTVGNTAVYFNELADDDRYMEGMNQELVRHLARTLDNNLCVRYRERVMKYDSHDRPRTTARYASIVVLVPEREWKDETLQGMRGASGTDKGDVRGDQTMGEKPDTTAQSVIADAERESSNTDSSE